ncbi:MAG: PQQ-dependent sugar dehydrogenase [bacterium]|nr:PQQ-dependent sugar dehydrogenase [bacterium]
MRKIMVWGLCVAALVGGQVFAQNAAQDTTPESTAPTANTITPPDPTLVQWSEFLTDEFDNPLYITNAGDGSNRLFVVEQTGYIFVVQDGEILFDPFLDVSMLLTPDVFQGGYTERGLIGLAFHPNYEENGTFYIHYINQDEHAIVARYRVSADDPNVADPNSAVILIDEQDPFSNHNGGQLAFGPDGYLYIGIGDGGDLGDPLGYAQNPGVVFGKILRIDVDSGDPYAIPETNPFVDNADYRPEIWAMGLRNPWRFSFDALTNDLYIGDVGESTWEEINVQPADFAGGANYGWNAFEANVPFDLDTPVPRGMILPVATYSHDEGCAVTAGHVYRGEALPALQGVFFYGDYCNGRVWTTYRGEDGTWNTSLFMETERQISSFGVDEAGELYLVDYKGSILKLTAAE